MCETGLRLGLARSILTTTMCEIGPDLIEQKVGVQCRLQLQVQDLQQTILVKPVDVYPLW